MIEEKPLFASLSLRQQREIWVIWVWRDQNYLASTRDQGQRWTVFARIEPSVKVRVNLVCTEDVGWVGNFTVSLNVIVMF